MKSKKISIVLNLLVFIFMVVASILMFAGIRFMKGPVIPLECSGIEFLKFFTIQSNMYAGLICLIFAIYQIKRKDISRLLYILKLSSTSAVFLTFVVVFGYLGWIAPKGLISLLTNSNLFFHLINPLLCVITFVLFEKDNNLTFKEVKYGVFPTLIYGVGYLGNALIHLDGGKVPQTYDFYNFLQYGFISVIVVPVMFIISYLLSLILWKLNKYKIH